jgi:hypothetical protein
VCRARRGIWLCVPWHPTCVSEHAGFIINKTARTHHLHNQLTSQRSLKRHKKTITPRTDSMCVLMTTILPANCQRLAEAQRARKISNQDRKRVASTPLLIEPLAYWGCAKRFMHLLTGGKHPIIPDRAINHPELLYRKFKKL